MSKHWLKKAFGKNKGALHRELGVPEGKTIPVNKLRRAAAKGGKIGMRARLAQAARSFSH